MLKHILPCLLLATALPCAAQKPFKYGWERVQGLPMGTVIHVKAKKGSTSCSLSAVDAESLTCTNSKSRIFARADIQSIEISHRLRSTLIGAGIFGGIGAGAGLGIGVAAGDGFVSKGKAALAGGAVFAVLGLSIGYASDLARSPVYINH